ncbi:helix-turn-helix transcriptional regulator [Lysinibacillus sp. KU-BSD001]|uniref:helix-turn-helix domain-containing protein n=1 Tax=Lysinibacillus sp. KU-BSD001 TaxID=3141328 RepID=UPI0036E051E6
MILIKSQVDFNSLLIKSGFSKRSFAKSCGISAASLIQISNRRQSPRPGTAKKICDTIGKSFDEIFEITESNCEVFK